MARTLVIGDSLGVGTVPYLRRRLGKVDADTRVGRSSANGIQALAGKRGYDRVILDLGTNDSSPQQIAASIARAKRMAPGAEIIVPTVNGRGAAAKNQAIRAAGVRVVQVGKADAGDGIHYTPEGYRQRADTLAQALSQGGGGAPAPRVPTTTTPAPMENPGIRAQAMAMLQSASQAPVNTGTLVSDVLNPDRAVRRARRRNP